MILLNLNFLQGGGIGAAPCQNCICYIRISENVQKSVLELTDTFELSDVYRDREPTGRSYTWNAYSNLKQARLDCFLLSTDLTGLVESIQTSAGYRTYHS